VYLRRGTGIALPQGVKQLQAASSQTSTRGVHLATATSVFKFWLWLYVKSVRRVFLLLPRRRSTLDFDSESRSKELENTTTQQQLAQVVLWHQQPPQLTSSSSSWRTRRMNDTQGF
jgi:hypothetical protein